MMTMDGRTDDETDERRVRAGGDTEQTRSTTVRPVCACLRLPLISHTFHFSFNHFIFMLSSTRFMFQVVSLLSGFKRF